ncbi:MAG: DNA-processing protein DprA [Bacteroidales bacterium]|nr:DNA-processing protein DprA [Bacteroidales bacterium]
MKSKNIFSKNELLANIQSPKLLFTLSTDDMTEQLNLNPKVSLNIFSQRDDCLKKAHEQIDEARKRDVKIIDRYSVGYPTLLKEIADDPVVLYVKGELILDNRKMLSIVGTRCATHYGIEQTAKIVSGLATSHICIVSGLALGIDTEAHKNAIDNGLPTIAVLGNGLDMIYPPTNKILAQKILDSGGAIISEMPFNTPMGQWLFPRRNRIIAGMTHATLVVEASVRGGALITAARANDYNRTVFAIAGRSDAPFSQGCNAFIKNNKAMLIENAEDILNSMGWDISTKNSKQHSVYASNLPEKEIEILEIIDAEKPCSLDLIFEKTNFAIPEILSILTKLEVGGFIKEIPGCMYESVRR